MQMMWMIQTRTAQTITVVKVVPPSRRSKIKIQSVWKIEWATMKMWTNKLLSAQLKSSQ